MKKQLCLALVLLLLLSSCGLADGSLHSAISSYGKVEVDAGNGTTRLVEKYQNIPENPLRGVEVIPGASVVGSDGVTYTALFGIDISEHQGAIDWESFDESGIDFLLIRAGYRGYGAEGKLNTDPYFEANLRGALAKQIPTGIYFFSQAISVEEAEAEAAYVLELLEGYSPESLALPVYFDWEDIPGVEARTDGMSGETMTACAKAFCETIKAAGYQVGVYAYRSLAYDCYDLSQLAEYDFWIGAVGDCPDFYYEFDIWQYSTSGELPGISGNVDLDMMFVPQNAKCE